MEKEKVVEQATTRKNRRKRGQLLRRMFFWMGVQLTSQSLIVVVGYWLLPKHHGWVTLWQWVGTFSVCYVQLRRHPIEGFDITFKVLAFRRWEILGKDFGSRFRLLIFRIGVGPAGSWVVRVLPFHLCRRRWKTALKIHLFKMLIWLKCIR